VSAGLCFGGIGSDTGGSIRQPSAFCGITGVKPTYGRVSTRGVVPLSWSLDHIGPMCRTVTDAAYMLEAIAAYDPLEPGSVDWPAERYSNALGAKRALRVGIPRRLFFDQIDPEIDGIVKAALSVVAKLAADVRDVDLPPVPALAIVGPEAYAFHAPYFTKTPDLYQAWTRERLKQATSINTTAYIDARRQLDQVRRSIGSVFSTVDVFVTPTTPVQPVTIEEAARTEAPPPGGEESLRNTRPFNAFGLPTVSIPCGFTDGGLPVGLQVAGPRFGEGTVLAFAHAFEQATAHHRRVPAL
jgi:aspartyl-tRNA(Asn)/glutamyl-tRNA(Gln) amidotransferase subunit A